MSARLCACARCAPESLRAPTQAQTNKQTLAQSTRMQVHTSISGISEVKPRSCGEWGPHPTANERRPHPSQNWASEGNKSWPAIADLEQLIQQTCTFPQVDSGGGANEQTPVLILQPNCVAVQGDISNHKTLEHGHRGGSQCSLCAKFCRASAHEHQNLSKHVRTRAHVW